MSLRIQSHFEASPMPFKILVRVKLRFNIRIRLFESVHQRMQNVDQKLALHLHWNPWMLYKLYKKPAFFRLVYDQRYITEVSFHISVYQGKHIVSVWRSCCTGCAWAPIPVCWSSYHGNTLFSPSIEGALKCCFEVFEMQVLHSFAFSFCSSLRVKTCVLLAIYCIYSALVLYSCSLLI